MASEQDRSVRESFNRIMGLSSYAGGVIVLGLLALSLYSDRGFKGDYQSYGLGLAAAVVLFAIGYTTGKRRTK
jgi:hypothetical protein